MTTTPTIIEKENVVDLQFQGIPIEKSKADMNKLIEKLRRSMVLGNIHRTKMRIIFEDSEGLKGVEQRYGQ